MFSQRFTEGQTGVAKFDEISATTMETMIKWMYTGELMNHKELEDLYIAADRYQVTELKVGFLG